MKFSNILSGAVLSILVAILYGCANIVPPEGGKKDETAPLLLSVTPADSSLNSRPSRIVLHFNEYVEIRDLDKHLQLSPLLAIPPTVLSYGKRVEIKIQDTQLRANTTYRISLGNAIVDNHEGNPYKGFVYQFSTGAYFDSLELKGSIYDAATGLPDTAALITLYPSGENDTSVLRKKPFYAVKADGSGNFVFQALPATPFRIYAIQDANNNFVYDYGEEKVAFLHQDVFPSLARDSAYNLFLFREIPDTAQLQALLQPGDSTAKKVEPATAATGRSFGARSSNTVKAPKNSPGYRVNVDTSDRTQRSVELTQPLTIDLHAALSALDTAKVYLSYENAGIEVEAVQRLRGDSSRISISTQWQPDKLYTLRLVKGWAKDTAGAELPPGKYFFRTKRTEDYSTLIVHVGKQYLGDSFLLYVYKGADSVYLKPLSDSVVHLPLLQPGSYGIRVIADANRNGKWDPGKLLQRRQPEKVLPYTTDVILKAGWENEVDFVPAEKGGRKKGLAANKDAANKTDKPKEGKPEEKDIPEK